MSESTPQKPAPANSHVTSLLIRYSDGDQEVLEELFRHVYQELRRLASRYVSRERSKGTLQATALVHEAYFRLVDQKQVKWQNRAHFLGVAAQQMRRILVDYHRLKFAQKRGGGHTMIHLDEKILSTHPAGQSTDQPDLVALDKALQKLAEVEPRQAKVVELRYFGGLTLEEVAEVTKISLATVKRDWVLAKAWLHDELTS